MSMKKDLKIIWSNCRFKIKYIFNLVFLNKRHNFCFDGVIFKNIKITTEGIFKVSKFIELIMSPFIIPIRKVSLSVTYI